MGENVTGATGGQGNICTSTALPHPLEPHLHHLFGEELLVGFHGKFRKRGLDSRIIHSSTLLAVFLYQLFYCACSDGGNKAGQDSYRAAAARSG